MTSVTEISTSSPASDAVGGTPGYAGPAVSVIIPAKNEAENLRVLIREIADALADMRFEVLVVDDGSDDHTDTVLTELKNAIGSVRHIRHEASAGQSAAVRSGLLHATGGLVLTIDGDGENNPAYFRDMIAKIEDAGPGTALVAGQRLGRKASLAKRIASRAANRLRSSLLGDGVRDSGCGLKCIRRSVFLTLPYFDGWHRYLPALVLREGYAIAVVDVVDRQRRHGVSKYGIFDRALVGILDLCGVWWLRRRRKNLPRVRELPLGD